MSQVFAFQNKHVRTFTENNEILFAAIDVCRALTIPWRGNTLANIPDGWKRTMRKFRMEGFSTRDLVFISEPAVYKLVFRSNKPQADAFTNWVASEVLPTIRKTGQYEAKPAPKALPAPKPKALPPAHDPLRAKVDQELARVDFFIKEIDAVEERVFQLLLEKWRNEHPGALAYEDKFHMAGSCATRYLWSAINANLEALRESVKARLEHCL